jgi:hypothetical protein
MPNASPYIDRESTIVRMANALDGLNNLSHEAERLIAYQRAGVLYGEAMAYDRDAHRRQLKRRDLRARGVLAVAHGLETQP